MEARALAHFNPPDGPLCDLRRSTSVTVPKLLYHHTEEHILVIEDLGPLVTLSEYISAIGNVKAASLLPWREPYRTLGARIGDFFGHLHSSESRAKVKTANSGTFENSLVKDLILQEAVIPIQKHLTRFNIPNASILFRRVLEDYQRANLPSEQRFVLGDFTPGAILLPTERGDGWQTLGVIDWEFSGLGRGPNGDMAQFLAHLHLLLMAAFGEDQRYHALESFISCICATYRMQSLTWLGDLSLRSPHPAAATSALESLQIFRSALILHGREMINNAAEQNCSGSGHNEGPHLIQEMVQKGAWYLERAGSDVEEMLDGANVNELFKEDHRIMLNLFGITD